MLITITDLSPQQTTYLLRGQAMLGWVITRRNDEAQDILHRLKKKYGPLEQCWTVGFWRGLSSSMLSHMICHALRTADSGEGVISLTDMAGAASYRVTSLMSHKHPQYEVVSDITYPLPERILLSRELLSGSAFRDCVVALGGPDVSNLWYQQQKNPPFVLKRDLYEY